MRLTTILLILLVISALGDAAPAAKPWQRVDGCRWKADRWNDGDSFHVITGDEQARESGLLVVALEMIAKNAKLGGWKHTQ
jgi:hypothetical protein